MPLITTKGNASRSVRDAEAAGSNPVTPIAQGLKTAIRAGHNPWQGHLYASGGFLCRMQVRDCIPPALECWWYFSFKFID